jgi:UDP-N-acetylglucosamine 2-epimerase (non-hydrolysing)/UDP-GlcNAc3NAcA epimerase
MSDVFFSDLDLPAPDVDLGVGSGPHGAQTGAMLVGIEEALAGIRPDRVVVFGDTNSTLAGAMVAAKLCLPLAHVEAGLRSFNRAMPEEVNRIVADHLAGLLFCPSDAAVANLAAEGRTNGVHRSADTMIEALGETVPRARARSSVLDRLGVREKGFVLATIHRAENTNDEQRLRSILEALSQVSEPVVFPVHPRTRAAAGHAMERLNGVRLIDPVGYLDMVRLESSARLIVTDSGGVQKEAYWLGVPCVTVRDQTEWVETVDAGWNRLTGADAGAILEAVREFRPDGPRPDLYAEGCSTEDIVRRLEEAA